MFALGPNEVLRGNVEIWSLPNSIGSTVVCGFIGLNLIFNASGNSKSNVYRFPV